MSKRYVIPSATTQSSDTTSAGLPTQHLGLPQISDDHRSANNNSTRNSALAAVLLLLGVSGLMMWYLVRQPGAFPDYLIRATRITTIDYSTAIVWLNIGAWATFFALWLRRYYLLAIGCIAGGIGIGEGIRQGGMLMEIPSIGALIGGLVIGLLLLYTLGRAVLHQTYRWPLYGLLGLTVIGAGIVSTGMIIRLSVWLIWLPLILIGTGIYLGVYHTDKDQISE